MALVHESKIMASLAVGAVVMPPLSADEMAFEAFRAEQLGRFAPALDGYRQALNAQPAHAFAAIRLFRLQRETRGDTPGALKIVWQKDPREAWESDWVRYLLSGLNCTEVVDTRHAVFSDGAIVVDSGIDAYKRAYYFEMLKRGNRFVLFHLSDEHYSDDCTPYSFANFVLRNYWSRAHASDAAVLCVPLGMMNGFRVASQKPAPERRYLWSFAGNLNKSSRTDMVAAMAPLEGGRLHGTNTVGTAASDELAERDPQAPLTVQRYAQLLADTVFAPCPAGWENLDTFRVCEALEAGCIPVVERRPSFDYFRHLFGSHPMISVESWSNAPQRIADLRRNGGELEKRRVACQEWWQDYKLSLVGSIRDRVLENLSAQSEGSSV
jgi:hypothetical protein